MKLVNGTLHRKCMRSFRNCLNLILTFVVTTFTSLASLMQVHWLVYFFLFVAMYDGHFSILGHESVPMYKTIYSYVALYLLQCMMVTLIFGGMKLYQCIRQFGFMCVAMSTRKCVVSYFFFLCVCFWCLLFPSFSQAISFLPFRGTFPKWMKNVKANITSIWSGMCCCIVFVCVWSKLYFQKTFVWMPYFPYFSL